MTIIIDLLIESLLQYGKEVEVLKQSLKEKESILLDILCIDVLLCIFRVY